MLSPGAFMSAVWARRSAGWERVRLLVARARSLRSFLLRSCRSDAAGPLTQAAPERETGPLPAPPACPSTTHARWNELEPEDRNDPVAHLEARSFGRSGDFLVIGASRRGRSHAHTGKYREDAFWAATGKAPSHSWAIMAVADGAGSQPLSRVGARIAVRSAVEWARSHEAGKLAAAVDGAARAALVRVRAEAESRGVPAQSLACTLLLAGIAIEDGVWTLATFQAGDGMIAAAFDSSPRLRVLEGADHGPVAGETHFLLSGHVLQSWEQRTRIHRFETPPRGILLMTDGIADDLTPIDRNGPTLARELDSVLRHPSPERALLELTAYEKRGSFDDRTLAMAWRGD